MQKVQTETKELTEQQKKISEQKQLKNNQVICTVLMIFLGLITSQRLLSFFFQKQRYPADYQPPNLLAFFALVSSFVFMLSLSIIVLRLINGAGLPAEREDPASIKSVNQAIKNAIIYTLVLLGLYYYLLENWKQDIFVLQMAPFVLFGLLVLDFLLRIVQFIVGAKGFRYLAQANIIFLLGILVMDCLKIASKKVTVDEL